MHRSIRARSRCVAPLSTSSTPSPATFPLRTCAIAWIETIPSTGLCRRASRNTLTRRLCTGDRQKGFDSASGSRSRRGRARKAGRRRGAAQSRGARRVHRFLHHLHWIQRAAGRSHLRRNGKAPERSGSAAAASRGQTGRRVDAARFRKPDRARLYRKCAPLLRPGAPVARGGPIGIFRRRCAKKFAGCRGGRGMSEPATLNNRAEGRMPWIAEDPASKAVLELARKVAETSTTLLITGESGAGKDHLARLIHEIGPRRDAPFLKIDCASLPQELVESELFGHERGAFTGAVERKLGRLEMAGGGTIVLDEIAALSPSTQSKLLRVLEERQFERLGGTETITIDARLIALTNADLARLVSEGQFRGDLFFRLSVLAIPVPPLRGRPADILPLAEALLERGARVHGRPGAAFSEPVKQMLMSYS